MIETFDDPLPDEIQRLATEVMRRVCDGQMLVALAESCTGGLVAAVLTDIEGCSHGFDRGFVVYTDEAKRDALGVSEALLKSHGAVSAAAAKAMAAGALERSTANFALSITGFAGRGAAGEEPGLVFMGLADRTGRTTIREFHFGDVSRAQVRRQCLGEGLALLMRAATDTPER